MLFFKLKVFFNLRRRACERRNYSDLYPRDVNLIAQRTSLFKDRINYFLANKYDHRLQKLRHLCVNRDKEINWVPNED